MNKLTDVNVVKKICIKVCWPNCRYGSGRVGQLKVTHVQLCPKGNETQLVTIQFKYN